MRVASGVLLVLGTVRKGVVCREDDEPAGHPVYALVIRGSAGVLLP